MWRTFCWRGRRGGAGNSRFARRWGRRGDGWARGGVGGGAAQGIRDSRGDGGVAGTAGPSGAGGEPAAVAIRRGRGTGARGSRDARDQRVCAEGQLSLPRDWARLGGAGVRRRGGVGERAAVRGG